MRISKKTDYALRALFTLSALQIYDNAELLRVYAQAGLATGDPLFKRIARETVTLMAIVATIEASQVGELVVDVEFVPDLTREKYTLSFNPGGYLKRVR